MVLAKGRPCLVIPAACTSARPLDGTLSALVAGSSAAGGFSGAAASGGDATVLGARAALLELSATNLLCLLREASEESLAATLRPADDDYDPRLTSSAAELCVASIRLVLGPLARLSPERADAAACDTVLVLARAADPREVPYPIFMRGHDRLSLRDLFVKVRSVFELCALDALDESRRQGPYVVTLTDDAGVSHFVGDHRLVAVSAPRALAGVALAQAIALAGEGAA
jgi:hypothetical protein